MPSKCILIFIIVNFIGLSFATAATSIDQAVREHRARVKDFDEYLKRRRAPPSKAGIAKLEEERRKHAADAEKARRAFVLVRKKVDPLRDEKRDRAYERYLAKKEKDWAKLRKSYVIERNQLFHALSKERQIDEFIEFRLVE
jgi:Skp family chaperone for outer membrane proteins